MIGVTFLKGKSVAVMGLGKSGTATARALLAGGAMLRAWDDDAATRSSAAASGIPVVDPLQNGHVAADLVVWSPGIPHTHPKPHPLAQAARAAGIPVVCDVALLARARPDARFVAVSGTNGKSTTTTLLAHLLAQSGRPTAAGGNLGTAALDLADLPEGGSIVLELSSYQLELSDGLGLKAAALLNITPDHLGRHGGMEGYIAAKRKLFDYLVPGGTAVVAVDDEPCRAIADELAGRGMRVVRISVLAALAQGVSAPDGVLLDNGVPVADLRRFPRLPGRHNWQNVCAAYAVARAEGVSPDAAIAALATYPGLAHRQELVAELNDVAWINDSKATNADATEKALVCHESIHWIVGGRPKEGGIDALAPYFPRIAHAYLIGESTEAFVRTLAGKVPYTCCGELGAAVELAWRQAKAGSVVLLSPACASWDQFKSFEHRGDVFREMVMALTGERAT
ncbi:UDP-N-acetylmuramoyl-L-alanine--D-glutamate ligase [Magnetospirillum molischianum]|uniref:UDP-N-acetylmuramoylalanine--D-glutamate ligase n=1 Tax=Magnetospirillum molischianum DSM 120 TaxID=1150626 RepID=H8FMQ7_MAGML|nr:UDP-N-acetylmuramoyl-L-alanine--D-glutamate ligase [Magnetospirillum molischianum]CCG39645.1 UDP-N-acetylmuramoylalanine-D-glutamate ligase [Magnetospirillum molischianum DSM 120]